MSDLSPELNLALADDDDDTADYLVTTPGLRGSLNVIDGLFNQTTGHAHNGAHQGGALEFQDLLVGGDLIVEGASHLKGPVLLDSTLTVTGATTLSTLHATGNVQIDGTLTSPSISNPSITGTVTGGASFASGPNSDDWFRVSTLDKGLYSTPVDSGIAFNAGGPYVYGSYGGGHLITETATQTLTNKTLANPVLNGPTISGTVTGGATWTGAQNLGAGSTVNGDTIARAPNSAFNTSIAGAVNALGAANDSATDVVVAFGFPFSSPPTVIIAPLFSSNLAQQDNWAVSARSVTTTGFTAQFLNRTGATNSLFASYAALGNRA